MHKCISCIRRWLRCDQAESACRCRRWRWHRGPHRCSCGGSWAIEDGVFVVYEWPDDVRFGIDVADRLATVVAMTKAHGRSRLLGVERLPVPPDSRYEIGPDGEPILAARDRRVRR